MVFVQENSQSCDVCRRAKQWLHSSVLSSPYVSIQNSYRSTKSNSMAGLVEWLSEALHARASINSRSHVRCIKCLRLSAHNFAYANNGPGHADFVSCRTWETVREIKRLWKLWAWDLFQSFNLDAIFALVLVKISNEIWRCCCGETLCVVVCKNKL